MVNATDRPIEALLDGQIDLAVVTSEIDDKRLVTEPLFEDELVAVVAPTHPFGKRAFIQPEDFAEEHLIIYSADPQDSYTFLRILRPANVEPGSDSRIGEGRTRRERHGAMGDRAGSQGGRGEGDPDRQTWCVPIVDRRHVA
jgi:DNA-binding transcriptional LysR family regulator